MTFEQFIVCLEVKNPAIFQAQKIQISVESLKTQLKIAYDAGYEDCRKFNAELTNFAKPRNSKDTDFAELFSNLFGK